MIFVYLAWLIACNVFPLGGVFIGWWLYKSGIGLSLES